MEINNPKFVGSTFISTTVFILAVCFAGCAKDAANNASTGSAGSCSLTDNGFTTCFDYTGSGYTTATAQTTCSSTTSGTATGTYSATACSSDGRIGSCQVYAGQPTEMYIRYLTGYLDASAQAACSSMSGVYTAN